MFFQELLDSSFVVFARPLVRILLLLPVNRLYTLSRPFVSVLSFLNNSDRRSFVVRSKQKEPLGFLWGLHSLFSSTLISYPKNKPNTANGPFPCCGCGATPNSLRRHEEHTRSRNDAHGPESCVLVQSSLLLLL